LGERLQRVVSMTDHKPEVSQINGVTLVHLGPAYENLDEGILDALRVELLQAVQLAEPPVLLLDLSCTKFFGSAFIEILFRMAHRLKQRKGKFGLSGVTEYCAEVLKVTHIDTLWPIYPTSAEGVVGLKG